MSIILTILGNIYLDKLLYFLGANETTFSFARDYLKILINVLFFMLFPFGKTTLKMIPDVLSLQLAITL